VPCFSRVDCRTFVTAHTRQGWLELWQAWQGWFPVSNQLQKEGTWNIACNKKIFNLNLIKKKIIPV